MKNTESLDTIYYCVIFKLFDGWGRSKSKRHLIINVVGLIQHIYIENALASKFKSKGILLWRRGFAFVVTGNERLWIPSGLRKIRFGQGRSPEKSPIGADGPNVWVLHSEQPQDCWLRWSKNFLGSCKIISAPNQQKVAWKTMPVFPPKNELWMFFLVWNVDCKLLLIMVRKKAKQWDWIQSSCFEFLKRGGKKCCGTMVLYPVKICYLYFNKTLTGQ